MKSKQDQRNYIIIGLCMILVVMGVGYAAFSSLLTINGTANISNSWCVGFDQTKTNTYTASAGIEGGVVPTGTMEYSGTACETNYVPNASLTANFKQPGDEIEYTLTIKNKSSVTADIKSITVGENSLTTDTTITRGNVQFIIHMPESSTLASNTETTMKVVAKFQNTTDITGPYTGETQTISVGINVEQDDGNGGMEFIDGVTFDGKTFPLATSGDGLYYDSNVGEYYYRGANPDNYIEFNNEVWRIMSINPSGNLKIIKDERIDLTGYSGVNTSNSLQGRFDASGATGRRTTGYCSNTYAQKSGCNAWAAMNNFANTETGDRYASGQVTEDAELNTYLNSTYKNSLSDLQYVQTGMKWNVGHAGEYNDTLTVSQLEDKEKAYTWTGDIALATKSEYIRAHGNTDCSNAKYLIDNYQNDTCKTTNYLYKSAYWYWLLSPLSSAASHEFLASSGLVSSSNASTNYGSVRPVLYLKSNIKLTGNGTNDENIYRIVS
ncbi:MAG: hypothetical protein IKE90_03945 [Bacilli bacterium]|nr:hypothetical protein [Bacilli bacterium]